MYSSSETTTSFQQTCHSWKHFLKSVFGIARRCFVALRLMSSTYLNLIPFNGFFIWEIRKVRPGLYEGYWSRTTQCLSKNLWIRWDGASRPHFHTNRPVSFSCVTQSFQDLHVVLFISVWPLEAYSWSKIHLDKENNEHCLNVALAVVLFLVSLLFRCLPRLGY